jgi:hypothetical protein
MGYKYGNASNKIRAAELLRRIRPKAAEIYEKTKDTAVPLKPETAIGMASLKWYTADKCVGVHVYQGDNGGWFADLAFKDLPPGIGDVLGTPTLFPNRDRQAAIATAIEFLAKVMANQQSPQSPDDTVPFSFDKITVFIPTEMVAEMKKDIEAVPGKRPSADAVALLLEDLRKQFAQGGPFTSEVMDRLSAQEQGKVFNRCSMALAIGMPRYPSYPEGMPPRKDKAH